MSTSTELSVISCFLWSILTYIIQPVKVTSKTTYSPPDTPSKTITYLSLASSFTAGPLVIIAGNSTFNFTLPAVQYARYDIV